MKIFVLFKIKFYLKKMYVNYMFYKINIDKLC